MNIDIKAACLEPAPQSCRDNGKRDIRRSDAIEHSSQLRLEGALRCRIECAGFATEGHLDGERRHVLPSRRQRRVTRRWGGRRRRRWQR